MPFSERERSERRGFLRAGLVGLVVLWSYWMWESWRRNPGVAVGMMAGREMPALMAPAPFSQCDSLLPVEPPFQEVVWAKEPYAADRPGKFVAAEWQNLRRWACDIQKAVNEEQWY